MYPTLLRDERFPTHRRDLRGSMPVRELAGMLSSWGVIATVTLQTERAEYPKRHKNDVIYPVGRFTTTLAGPELAEACDRDEIQAVHCAAVYQMGRPFRDTMTLLIGERLKARAEGRTGDETFCKLVANSLAGKLAQREGGWTRSPQDDVPGKWGEWCELSLATGKLVRKRHLCGAAWKWEEAKLPKGPHTSAFAYLTSYGRVRMSRIRAILPERSVVSQDTDGLMLLPAGIRALRAAGMLDRGEPGALRVVDTTDSAQFWGPRHYRWGAEWVLSGYRCPVVCDNGAGVMHSIHTPLWDQRDPVAPRTVLVKTQVSQFPDPRVGGVVGRDGWITPKRFGKNHNREEE